MSATVVSRCPACGAANRVQVARLGDATEARCGACKAPLPPPAEAVAVDRSSELAALLQESPIPVLIDFWAPWCGPCRAVAPEIAKVAARHAGKILVVKVNTDVDPAVSAAHRIQSIPTMALFRHGVEAARTAGARPAAAIEEFARSAGAPI